MKLFFTAILLSATFAIFGQKEKIDLNYDKKSGLISVNEQSVFKVIEEKNTSFPAMRDYTIQSLDGKDLIVLVFANYDDWHEVSQSNPKGSVSYYEVKFFDENRSKAEIGYNIFKSTMKLIYTNNLIKDGKLDAAAVEKFVLKNGEKFSELKTRR